ncbi:MAG: hypothetical protein M3452_09365 [Chloroflexota bacterium]|nr:hypothetical protein [Chloroflexota bacterium]
MAIPPSAGSDLERARLPLLIARRRTLSLISIALVTVLATGAGIALTQPPTQDPDLGGLPPWHELDRRWGTYLSEREWGTPREDVGGNGWGRTWTTASDEEYRYFDDGIAGISDEDGEFRIGWAFWDGKQPRVTERLNGASNPQGEHGESILEDRVFHESSPTHSYGRMTYRYPFEEPRFSIELESAKLDSGTLVLRATVSNTSADPGTLHLVLKGWMTDDASVTAEPGALLLNGESSRVAIAGGDSDDWLLTSDRSALDELLRGPGLHGGGSGHIGLLSYELGMAAGDSRSVVIGIAESTATETDDSAVARALAGLERATEVLDLRAREATQLFTSDVSTHEPLYRQALMSLLWNESFYRWDGTTGVAPEWEGRVDARDVLIMPDKWEYPWIASWDSAFHAVTAALIDPQLGADQLRFLLSDRWQQPDGHIPCAEWVMDVECPPIFAWATWEVFQAGADRAFLEEVYPALQRQYDYWWAELAIGPRGLFTGGFMGMDNLPRPNAAAQADASGWMALFAADLAAIADELDDPAAAERYRADRTVIADAVNAHLWDDDRGFYFDRDTRRERLFTVRSYTGLVPLVAGIVPPDRLPRILDALRDEDVFLSPGGIRSLEASSPVYEPGYAGRGINSNWLGPVWLPLQLLLVDALVEADPTLAADIRQRVVTNVEREWLATGRLWEYYDGDSGQGLGADAQAGWTAAVANLIADGWGAVTPEPIGTVQASSPEASPKATADTASPTGMETTNPVFEGSVAEVRSHLASLLLDRTSRDYCVIDHANEYELEALQREAARVTEGTGPAPRLFDGRYFLGGREEAIAAFGGTELLASSGGAAWYLAPQEERTMPGLHGGVLLVAVSLMELESADGRPVWWRSEDYVAVEPECSPVE